MSEVLKPNNRHFIILENLFELPRDVVGIDNIACLVHAYIVEVAAIVAVPKQLYVSFLFLLQICQVSIEAVVERHGAVACFGLESIRYFKAVCAVFAYRHNLVIYGKRLVH